MEEGIQFTQRLMQAIKLMLETALTNKPYKTNIIEVTTGLQAYNMPAYWLQVDVINILKLSPTDFVSNISH